MVQELLSWLKENFPHVYEGLRGPAQPQDIDNLEDKLSIELPQTLRSMYLLHDGQNEECSSGPFYGLRFLSLEEIESEWNLCVELLSDLNQMPDLGADPDLASVPPATVKLLSSNPRWIPFAHDAAGNFLGLDYDPDSKGTVGQVINFGSDELKKYVLGESFDGFLSWYLNELSSGNYSITKEEYGEGEDSFYVFDPKIPANVNFLDSLSTWF